MTFSTLPTLTLVLPNREDLIARLDTTLGRPSLFVSGTHTLHAGQVAALHLSLVHEREAVQLRVEVGWVRHRPHPLLPMGTALLLDEASGRKIDLLAHGLLHLQARRRRYQIELAAGLSWSGLRYRGVVLDISRTGCFVKVAQTLPIGALVAVHLNERDVCDHLIIPAHVVRWDAKRGGVGLRFAATRMEFAIQALIGHINAVSEGAFNEPAAPPWSNPHPPAAVAEGLGPEKREVQTLRAAVHS